MKMRVVNFLNPSYGKKAVFVPTANTKDPITSVVPVRGPVFMNVHDENGNLL